MSTCFVYGQNGVEHTQSAFDLNTSPHVSFSCSAGLEATILDWYSHCGVYLSKHIHASGVWGVPSMKLDALRSFMRSYLDLSVTRILSSSLRPSSLTKYRYNICVSKYFLYWDDREVLGSDEWTTVKCSASEQTDRSLSGQQRVLGQQRTNWQEFQITISCFQTVKNFNLDF